MPVPHPVEFRQRAAELARTGDKPVAALAKDLGISESCLRSGWARPTPTTIMLAASIIWMQLIEDHTRQVPAPKGAPVDSSKDLC